MRAIDEMDKLRRFYRTYKSVPILMRRTLGTAIAIVDHLEDIDFADLTFTVFAVCHDKHDYESLIRPFESQLELANVNPSHFIDHLHDFYLSIVPTIRKSGSTFFDVLAFVYDRVFTVPQNERNAKSFHIYYAYLDLLLQTLEYLHPNQSDFYEQVVGIRTDNVLICKQEPIKNLDIGIYEIEQKIFADKGTDIEPLISRTFRKYGLNIKTDEEIHKQTMIIRNYDNNVAMMIPWINEYTYDLLPERLAVYEYKMPDLKNGFKNMIPKESFRKRRRTLSSNGVTLKIAGNPCIEEIKFKELFHADTIYLIGRARLIIGDFMFRFNTQTGAFIDSFLDAISAEGKEMHSLLESTCLWAYAKNVLGTPSSSDCKENSTVSDSSHTESTNNATEIIGNWEDYFDGNVLERQVMGGKLRNYLTRRTNNLETEDRTINGYIRKLPIGQKASEEARERAEMLGFELEEGETYVQSFIRSTWVVKNK